MDSSLTDHDGAKFHGAHLAHDIQLQSAHLDAVSLTSASKMPTSSLSNGPPTHNSTKNYEENTSRGAVPIGVKGSEFRRWYLHATIDGVEYIEQYRPGGLLPISLGNSLVQGRYFILQKLGHGGSSTTWLARDRKTQPGRLVTLKAMSADLSHQDPSQIPDLAIPQHLQALNLPVNHFQTPSHYHYESSANGKHLVVVYPLAGPNVASLYSLPTNHYWQPPKIVGSRRFRGDLARKVAKETATGLHQMHSAGIVHGDLTTSNILVRIAPTVLEWSDAEVKAQFGEPTTDKVELRQGGLHGPHAPPLLYEPIPISNFSDASLLQESTVINDFGQSYFVASPPADYHAGTLTNYMPPEMVFEGRCTQASDIWMLACLIYEVRTGLSLFDLAWSIHDEDLVMHMVEMLGRLPDPWWAAFKYREQWFHDNGDPRSEDEQMSSPGIGGGAFPLAVAETLHDKLRLTGTHRPSDVDEGPMCEPPGVRMDDDEVELLGDLLGKMLKYKPEERVTIEEVIEHPWFAHTF